MSAWGYGALEGDAAYDWIAPTMRPVVLRIDEALHRPLDSHNAAAVIRTAAYLLERVGYEGLYPSCPGLCSRFDTDSALLAHLELAIERLQQVKADDAVAATWDDPKVYRKAIDRQISALKKRLEDPSAPHAQTLLERIGLHLNPSAVKRRMLSW